MSKGKPLKLDPRNPDDVALAEEIVARIKDQYKDDPNVVNVAIGLKVKGGVAQTGKLVLIFFVKDKLTKDELKERGLKPIPSEIEGLPTDVEPIKMFPHGALAARRERRDPLLGGIAIGNSNRQWHYGTLGCIVFDEITGRQCALTNEHVLVFTNEGEEGDPVIQPAPPRLEDFIDLDLTPSCCPIGPIFFVEVGGPISGFLGWCAVVAGAVALADERDPTRRGQDNTDPAPGETTIREVVDVSIKYPDFPIPGTPYRVDVEWDYARHTTGKTYYHKVKETNTNQHILEQQMLMTNSQVYHRGDTVHLLAAILPPSNNPSSYVLKKTHERKPCTSYHAIAQLVPSDQSQRDRFHQLILHPQDDADYKKLIALFPDADKLFREQKECVNFHAISPDSQLPAKFIHEGLDIRHISGNPMGTVDMMPDISDGLSELLFNIEGIEVDLPISSEWVNVRVAQFTASPIVMTIFNNQGQVINSVTGPEESKVEHFLELQGEGITRVELKGGGGEGILIELCYGGTAPGEYCLFYGQTNLEDLDPIGFWNTFLFVQTINDVQPGLKPDEAAQTIGGLPITCNFVYAGEGSIPSLGSGCIFKPKEDGDFEVRP